MLGFFLGAVSRFPLQSFIIATGLNPWQFKKGFPLQSGLLISYLLKLIPFPFFLIPFFYFYTTN
jgi:hypothetical protein